ncbi:MAG: aminodeoxychorismate synthase component I [Alphaproteobacteria bacterium]|nr:aminodeoxychorismate synthase component I [Alphaproteobacteria bacterium]
MGPVATSGSSKQHPRLAPAAVVEYTPHVSAPFTQSSHSAFMRSLNDCFALFDDATWPSRPARLLSEPVRLVEATDVRDVEQAFDAVEDAVAQGMFAGGYCAYELGYAFEPRLAPLMPRTGRPLMRFVLFGKSEILTSEARREFLSKAGEAQIGPATANVGETDYRSKIGRIRELIGDGDVYQVNFTLKLRMPFEGDPLRLYARLRETARAGAASFLSFPDEDIVSLSPERFFAIEDGCINARPMKGTCPRAPDWRSDATRKLDLRADPKQRAENLMIVDLLRNDISRVAKIGTVTVDDLFTVETYPAFHSMTSGISAVMRDDVRLRDAMKALFPCGSVTGAPKIRAMEIIRELEQEPRGVYCGAVGVVDGKRAAFNVAIRTLAVRDGAAEMGIGGGIVWDSDAASEYQECLLKARFLTAPPADFQLIETMRWTPQQGFFLFKRHLARLKRSARYFGFVIDQNVIRDRLIAAIALETAPQRVRLTLARDGAIEVSTAALAAQGADAVWKYVVSGQRTNSADPRFHHKTTERQLYDGELRRLQGALGVDEVVFLNERGEVTEGSRTTLFLERNGRWYTPPLACGVLDGCLRGELIERADPIIEERVLSADDLATGQVWFGNTLRGLIRGQSVAAAAAA